MPGACQQRRPAKCLSLHVQTAWRAPPTLSQMRASRSCGELLAAHPHDALQSSGSNTQSSCCCHKVGTYPSGASMIPATNPAAAAKGALSLEAWLEHHPEALGSVLAQKRAVGQPTGRLPFLMKVPGALQQHMCTLKRARCLKWSHTLLAVLCCAMCVATPAQCARQAAGLPAGCCNLHGRCCVLCAGAEHQQGPAPAGPSHHQQRGTNARGTP